MISLPCGKGDKSPAAKDSSLRERKVALRQGIVRWRERIVAWGKGVVRWREGRVCLVAEG
jgi:hypothetical protein